MSLILKAENISKQYRLGVVGTGTLSHDLNRWWHQVRGKEDPYLKIGDTNDRASKGSSDYVWALRDISFEVNRGEVLGIIGKNGAGKSTLLKILSRVTTPTTGVIKTAGRIASLLEVGTGFHPELTGKENIYLNGAILGMTKAEITSKLEEIVDFSGCERYVDTPVKRYSSGMKVRLAFAVAAHLEPEILVVDEVLAVGDAEFQKKAIGKMQDISKGEGRTVLFVSHNMAAVRGLCTTGIVLEHGRVVYSGTANDSVNYYLSEQSGKVNEELEFRSDRTGSQKLSVVNIAFYNNQDTQITETISGDYVKIRIFIKKNQSLNYNDLLISVAFLDANQHQILTFASDEMGYKFGELEHKDYFDLVIPELRLRSNAYSLRLLLTEKDTRKESFVDYIENAATLFVLPGDLWNTGKLNRKGTQAILNGEFSI